MRTILTTLSLLLILSACSNKIEDASTLSAEDIARIRDLKLLDTDEELIQFYSEFKNEVAGNFYTDKRVACYWIDEVDTADKTIESAYYRDILKIDTVYDPGPTYSPFLLVIRKDSTSFRVCADGSKDEIARFFNGALEKWKAALK